ncbi:MAG: sigma-54-dependent Fis family transcriptional regulator [Acidobacteria bacterium]|nr:sigma-54-dependent Fis family transcriptional regulator [Acidobacteriota bacterium]
MGLCLVVEDDASQRMMLRATLKAAGHRTAEAASGSAALRAAGDNPPDVILLDLGLPDADGLELIPKLLAAAPLSRIVVITGQDSVATAVGALRSGARHYLVKPWDREELLVVVGREARAVQADQARALRDGGTVFWGSAPQLEAIRGKLLRIARSPFTPVLVSGETGAGKEVVARELHRLSAPPGPFIPVNCAAVPDELLESELFGHERGAFTSAQARRRGLTELADGGTLFLDEVGDMSLSLQAKLLRFLQDHRFFRVGGEQEISIRCRVVAATNRDLEAMMQAGAFRSDLYYRLAVVTLHVPPLRERREDIVPLAYHLQREIATDVGKDPRQLSPAAELALVRHLWPGNVRELRNRLERALILGAEATIQPSDLDLSPGSPAQTGGAIGEPERLRRVLEEESWVVARAARRLGVPRHWLRYRIKKHGLSRRER